MRDYGEGLTELEQGSVFDKLQFAPAAAAARADRGDYLLQYLLSNVNEPISHRRLRPRYIVTEAWIGYRFVMPDKL